MNVCLTAFSACSFFCVAATDRMFSVAAWRKIILARCAPACLAVRGERAGAGTGAGERNAVPRPECLGA